MNYANLNGGFTGDALRAMTGMPVSNFMTNQMSAKDILSEIKMGQ